MREKKNNERTFGRKILKFKLKVFFYDEKLIKE